MKRFIMLIIGLMLAWLPLGLAAPSIRDEVLQSKSITTIAVGLETATILSFPYPVETVIGLGLGVKADHPNTLIHYGPEEPESYLVLRCLRPGATVSMKLQIQGKFHVFDLRWSLSPDDVVNFRAAKREEHKVREVTKAEILEARPNYSPSRLMSLIKLARGEAVLRESAPSVYANVQSRSANYERRYKNIRTVITRVHRFVKADALVFQARIDNRGETAFHFDPQHLEVRIGSSQYRPTLTVTSGKVPPGESAEVYIALVGGIHGQREAIDIQNEFLLTFSSSLIRKSTPTKTSVK